MFKLYRTDSSDTDFQLLVRELDLELKVRDGEDHAFYAQYNKSDNIIGIQPKLSASHNLILFGPVPEGHNENFVSIIFCL